MTNQMKKILLVCLIMSYISFASQLVTLIVSGFTYRYVISYILLAVSFGICVFFQYLQIKVHKQDKVFREQIQDAKKLLELRELAKYRFYKSRGLEPRYNEDGTILEPDKFIGILTKLDENGELEKSIYEILGIEPVFDKDGNEILVIIVLKHLMKKPKTKDLDKIKGLSGKLVAKGTEKTPKKDEKKQDKQKAPQSAAKKGGSGKSKQQDPLYVPYISAEGKKSSPGKSGGSKGGKQNAGAKTSTNVDKKTDAIQKPSQDNSQKAHDLASDDSPLRVLPLAVAEDNRRREEEQDISQMD